MLKQRAVPDFDRVLCTLVGQAPGGQHGCPPRARQSRGAGGQLAETAARGGRPQAEKRVPVPLGAREARAGQLSTGGRAKARPLMKTISVMDGTVRARVVQFGEARIELPDALAEEATHAG